MLCELICTLAFENYIIDKSFKFQFQSLSHLFSLKENNSNTGISMIYIHHHPPSPSGWGLSYNFTNEYLKELILEIRITKSRMSIFAPINGYVSCSVSSNALGNVNTETLIDFLEQEMQLK